MKRAPGARPRGFIAFGPGHLSIRGVRASERVEVEALRSLFSVPNPAGAVREAGDALAVRVDAIPGRELNRIAGLYDVSALDGLTSVYDERPYWISLDPEAGLDDELIARGYVRDGSWQKFERGVESIEPRTDLAVEEARSADDVATFLRACWGVPEDAARWLSSLTDHPEATEALEKQFPRLRAEIASINAQEELEVKQRELHRQLIADYDNLAKSGLARKATYVGLPFAVGTPRGPGRR